MEEVIRFFPTEVQNFVSMVLNKLFITVVNFLHPNKILVCHHNDIASKLSVQCLIGQREQPWIKKYNMRDSFLYGGLERMVGLDHGCTTV